MTQTAIESRTNAMPEARRFAFPTRTAFLSQAALLEEAGPPRLPALACLLGFVLVCVSLIAGMVIQIDVITTGTGRIAAAGGNQTLQTFDGGIVEEVLVEEGQLVEKDDLLIALKDPEGEAQLERLTMREAALAVQVGRLRALAELPVMPSPGIALENIPVISEQMSILPLERNALHAKRSQLEAEIERRAKAVRNLRALEKETAFRLSLIEDKLEAQRGLFAKGLSPRAQLLEAERDFANVTFDLTELQGQVREAEAALDESRKRLDDVIAERRQRQGDRLSSLLVDLNDTRQQIQAMQKRLQRGRIRATARGAVQELNVRHRGQTVAPGEPVAEIIPIDGSLIAEVRLPPSEIGHVRKSQPVRIAIDGIEPHRHGYLKGEIDTISPSTFLDENALPYYRASITIAGDRIGDISLVPGMTVQARIKTGERTILEYLLKPVYRAWDTAFRER